MTKGLRVLIRCPAALPAGAEITAHLIGTEESITVQIRLDVGRIDQIRIRAAEGVNPQDLGSARAGAPIRFLPPPSTPTAIQPLTHDW